MVAFVVYDPTDPYSGDEYAVLRYGDCAAEDVSSQGGSDTAMVVPEASMVNFQFAAQILENPPEPSGSWTALMLVTPATGHIGFMFGSAISSDVDVLQQRDQLLSDSDWTQLADAPPHARQTGPMGDISAGTARYPLPARLPRIGLMAGQTHLKGPR